MGHQRPAERRLPVGDGGPSDGGGHHDDSRLDRLDRLDRLIGSIGSIGPTGSNGSNGSNASSTGATALTEPLTATAHYVRPVEHGPADLSAEVLRSGRRFRTVSAALVQEGRERVRALATFGSFADQSPPTLNRVGPPDLPPPDRCPNLLDLPPPEGMPAPPDVFSRFELRLAPGVGWTSGRRAGATEISGWIRFVDGRPPDALSLLLFADAFPPAVLDVEPSAWVPTLELTVHVRGRPAPGWLRARFATRLVRDGLLEEDGEIWDADGQLVAMSRQLALLLPVG